jgi:hypothetical protein
MCDFCKKDTGVDYSLIGNTTITACPNCIAVNIANGTMLFPEGTKTSEISGHNGAFTIKPAFNGKEFVVDRFEAVRLFGHQLMPDEYRKLLENHSADEFELHDDFYSESGLAYQPLMEEKYTSELKTYAKDCHDKNVEKYAEALKSDMDIEEER